MFKDLPEHGIVARAVVALWADVQRDMLGGAPVFGQLRGAAPQTRMPS
jgi:hypothetical protein